MPNGDRFDKVTWQAEQAAKKAKKDRINSAQPNKPVTFADLQDALATQ